MFSRLTICCVICAFGSFAVACGGDDSSDKDANTAAGTGGAAARSGSGSTAGTTGEAGVAAAGRGTGRGSTRQTCPAGKPEATDMCTPASGDCRYDSSMCDCPQGMTNWVCWAIADCPTTLPGERTACPTVGMNCAVGSDDCRCTAEGWDCGQQFCPPEEPALGSECEGGDGECTYGARICDCDSSKWACWAMSDCPTEVPARRAACMIDGMICPFEGGTCECGSNGWSCSRGVMQPPPPSTDDAGI